MNPLTCFKEETKGFSIFNNLIADNGATLAFIQQKTEAENFSVSEYFMLTAAAALVVTAVTAAVATAAAAPSPAAAAPATPAPGTPEGPEKEREHKHTSFVLVRQVPVYTLSYVCLIGLVQLFGHILKYFAVRWDEVFSYDESDLAVFALRRYFGCDCNG